MHLLNPPSKKYITTKTQVDEKLDLGAITGRRGPEQGGRYRVAGIIYHLGISMQSGHYKAEFRDDQGRWWRADDTQVSPGAWGRSVHVLTTS